MLACTDAAVVTHTPLILTIDAPILRTEVQTVAYDRLGVDHQEYNAGADGEARLVAVPT